MALFDKFRHGRRASSEIDDIIRNLNHMLNSKKDFASYVKEFGVGDYNEFQSVQDVVETLVAEIKDNIRRFEPRVRVVHMEQLESDMASRLRFEMKCQIMTRDKPLFLTFDSAMAKVTVGDV